MTFVNVILLIIITGSAAERSYTEWETFWDQINAESRQPRIGTCIMTVTQCFPEPARIIAATRPAQAAKRGHPDAAGSEEEEARLSRRRSRRLSGRRSK
jgi:hypothetical protein